MTRALTEKAAPAPPDTPPTAKTIVGPTPRETAIRMLAAGLWPVPLYPKGATIPGRDKPAEGKEPIGKAWGAVRNTPDTIHDAFRRWPKAGIGIALGPGRGPNGEWLIDVEGDGPEAEESRARLYGGEAIETLGWGSARGRHQLLTADHDRMAALLPALKGQEGKGLGAGTYHLPEFPDLEKRSGGTKPDGTVKQLQSAFPPTVGTDDYPRQWNGVSRIAPAPEAFYRALERAANRKGQPSRAGNGHTANDAGSGQPGRDGNAVDAYARKALQGELAKLENAVEPNRNNQLNFSAFALGQFIGAGALDRGMVENALAAAARSIGLGDGESAATIRSGIEAGMGQPRDLSKVGPKRRRRGKHTPPPNGHASADVNGQKRPAIVIATDRHRVLAETLAVLPSDPDLYRRGHTLVRVVNEVDEVAKLRGGITLRNTLGSARTIPVGEAGLSCRLTALAEFFTWQIDGPGEFVAIPAHPPKWLTAAILGDEFYPGIRPLHGVAEVPFPRPDGSLVTEPGYDPTTGYLYTPSVVLGPLIDQPTQEDARAAAALLLGLVYQFPFASEDDAAVWLAALLTILARPGIAGPVPGIALNANRAGVGKGRLIDGCGMIATGRPVPTSGYPRDDAEAAKTKVALALDATSIVHLDNLDEGLSYGGGALDSALTAMSVNDRILGQSQTARAMPLRCIWFLSGNNVAPKKDAHRRWLVCNLATTLERPEERADLTIPDLLSHIAERRAMYVEAALTILKAHALAGRPNGGWAPLGSFEEWDRCVRGAVWFATGRDCTATQRKAAEEAPERLDHLALLEAWAALPQGGLDGYGVTAAEAFRLAEADRDSDLAAALMRFSRDGKIPTPRVIGNRLRAIAGRNYGGLAFRIQGLLKRDRLWHVVNV